LLLHRVLIFKHKLLIRTPDIVYKAVPTGAELTANFRLLVDDAGIRDSLADTVGRMITSE